MEFNTQFAAGLGEGVIQINIAFYIFNLGGGGGNL